MSARAIRLLPDGRVLVVTTDELFQYSREGTPDPAFGVDGFYEQTGNRVVMDALRRGQWLLGGAEPGVPPAGGADGAREQCR